MASKLRRAVWSIGPVVVLLAVLTSPATAGGNAEGPGDHGLFLNILPTGQGHSLTGDQTVRWAVTGDYPPDFLDQLDMYNGLPASLSELSDGTLTNFFKSERFGVDSDDVVSEEHPKDGVTILRDRFGVPHIYGATRDDAMWATGYVTAVDRLFMADVLRHVGRGHLSEFLGATTENLEMDRAAYLTAGYSERELEMQIERAALFGAVGQLVLRDAERFVAGMNARIQEDLAHPSKLPAEYVALQLIPNHWRLTDVVAVAIVIQAEFAGGGGNELANAVLLARLQERHGTAAGRALFDDLLEANDPEAPTTAGGRFPYLTTGPVDPDAVALPDPDSVRLIDPLTVVPPESSSGKSDEGAQASTRPPPLDLTARFRRAMAGAGFPLPSAMSNWLGVTADRSASGHPIAVMGPQVGYFMPEILMEIDLHAPGLDARGATFPGISLYVLLGRGPNYAWSATSGASDLTDVRAEQLCDPAGGTPSVNADHYLFRGRCIPMYRRTDEWLAKPSGAGVAPPRVVRARVVRTVHGIVFARGVVAGTPVAFATERSTFAKEVDSAGTFALANGGRMTDPSAFRTAFSLTTGSFNWLYLNDRHLAYFHSGLYPNRAPGVDPDLPSWGTGSWEWRGFVSASRHPQAVDPSTGWIDSWNNKPAPGWRAADSTYSFGPVHRVQMLSSRLAPRAVRGDLHPADLVRIMADAATVDLRGQEVLPDVLAAMGRDPTIDRYVDILESWIASGAHRIDRDGDGRYDEQAAVALMDAWWEPLIHAMFDPTMDGLYDDLPMAFDDENRLLGLGSAFQDGYYGYVDKAVRMAMGRPVRGAYSVLRCADGTPAGCREALRNSLADVLETLGPDPAAWDAHEAGDAIVYTPVGLVSIDPQPWQNRPTFQQVVEPTSHP